MLKHLKYLFTGIVMLCYSISGTVYSQCLSGNYTVGTASSNYLTLTSAINDLVVKGMCGTVVFNIKRGGYGEQVSIPSITGNSSVNKLIIQSESLNRDSVYLNVSNVNINYVIQLNGIQYVSIKHITLTGNALIPLIDIKPGSNTVEIENNNFQSGGGDIITGTSINDIKIKNNLFNKCSTSVNLSSVTSSGSVVIEGNTMTDGKLYFVKLLGFKYIDINKNFLKNVTNSVTNNAVQINNGPTDSLRITSNNIQTTDRALKLNNSHPLYGGVIANNMISPTAWQTAINDACHFYDCSNMKFYFNSIFYGQGREKALLFDVSVSNFDIRNNIIAGDSTNYSVYFNVSPVSFVMDYNNIAGDIRYKTVVDSTGLNHHLYKFTPYFKNQYTDLHLNSDINLDSKGVPIPGINNDIDGDVRSALTPDVGADEFNPFNNDAGTFKLFPLNNTCDSIDSVFVQLKNFGYSPLTSCTINWSLNNNIMPSTNWLGNIATLQIDSPFFVGVFTKTINGGPYAIKVWPSQPNGVADSISRNDTISRTYYTRIMAGTYIVGGSSGYDYLNNETVIDDLNLRGICGNVVFQFRSGLYGTYGKIIGDILGTSVNDSIIFETFPGDVGYATISRNCFNPTVYNFAIGLDGTKHFTLRNMKFQRPCTSTGYTRVMSINNASHINIINDSLFVPSNLYTWPAAEADNQLISLTGNNDNINIVGNTLNGGMVVMDSHIYGKNYFVKGNVFGGQKSFGFRLSNIDSLVFMNNKRKPNYIYSYQYAPSLILTDINKMLKIWGNDIASVEINDCISDSANWFMFVNNRVMGIQRFTVDFDNCKYIKVLHNTLYSDGKQQGSPILIDEGPYEIFNNIFVAGPCPQMPCAPDVPLYRSISGVTYESDYNCFYSVDSAVYGGSVKFKLNQVHGFGKETHSIFVEPLYTWHAFIYKTYGPWQLNGKGKSMPLIKTDIFDNLRDSLYPDMGVDEFDGVNNINDTLTNATCNGVCDGSIKVTHAIQHPPYTYQWSAGNQTTLSVTGLCPGEYTLTVVDSLNDSTLINITIKSNITIVLSHTTTASSNGLADGVAIVNASGGSMPYTYLWNDSQNQTTSAATGLLPGIYSVTVSDANGCYDTANVTVIAMYTGINDDASLSDLVSVFPNPHTENFTIIITGYIGKNCTAVIYDIYGNIVRRLPVTQSGNEIVNTTHLSQGVYYLQIENGGEVIHRKVLTKTN